MEKAIEQEYFNGKRRIILEKNSDNTYSLGICLNGFQTTFVGRFEYADLLMLKDFINNKINFNEL